MHLRRPATERATHAQPAQAGRCPSPRGVASTSRHSTMRQNRFGPRQRGRGGRHEHQAPGPPSPARDGGRRTPSLIPPMECPASTASRRSSARSRWPGRRPAGRPRSDQRPRSTLRGPAGRRAPPGGRRPPAGGPRAPHEQRLPVQRWASTTGAGPSPGGGPAMVTDRQAPSSAATTRSRPAPAGRPQGLRRPAAPAATCSGAPAASVRCWARTGSRRWPYQPILASKPGTRPCPPGWPSPRRGRPARRMARVGQYALGHVSASSSSAFTKRVSSRMGVLITPGQAAVTPTKRPSRPAQAHPEGRTTRLVVTKTLVARPYRPGPRRR